MKFETLTSWEPLGHSRPVTGLIYFLLIIILLCSWLHVYIDIYTHYIFVFLSSEVDKPLYTEEKLSYIEKKTNLLY